MAIYFLRDRQGPIKIGYAEDPHARQPALQTGNPYPLELLGTCEGDREVEAALHRRFDEFRIQGEWFRPEKFLVDFIEGLGDFDPRIYEMRPENMQSVVLMEKGHPVLDGCRIFAFDGDAVAAAMSAYEDIHLPVSLEGEDADYAIDLPPLPFPKVALEATDPAGWMPPSEIFIPESGWDRLWSNEARLIVVYELRQGEKWIATMPISGSTFVVTPSYVGPAPRDELAFQLLEGDSPEPWEQEHFRDRWSDLFNLPEDKFGTRNRLGKHIVLSALCALGVMEAESVRHEEIGLARPVRRRIRRSLDHAPDEIYRVDVRPSGERQSCGPSDSGRTLSCRFLVRGHWRHRANGRKVRVKAHIKGPVGAPWKGRAIWVTRGNRWPQAS